MRGRWFAVGTVVGLTFAGAQSGTAQVRVATTTWEPNSGRIQSSPQAGETSRLVSLAVRDASVAHVLTEIQRRSGVSIAGGDAVLNEPTRITVKIVQRTPIDAVNLVLQKTSLVASQSSSGTIIVTKRSRGTRQDTGVLIGKIIHATTKQPISGATVSIDGSDRTVVTEADGTFRLTLDAGDHVVRIRAVGFVRQEKKVAIQNEAEVSIEVSLDPSASVLNEVIVTGTVVATERKAIPNPITVITAEQIEQRGITRVDQLFRGEVPGVVALERGVERYGAHDLGNMAISQVYARGSSTMSGAMGTSALTQASSPMKVYVDGVELLDPGYLGVIDPVSIERIEIITGPQAATVYGSGAMGGVMQIFTKKGTSAAAPDLTLRMQYGVMENNLSNGKTPLHRHALNLSGNTPGGFSYAGSASYTYSGQWRPHLFNRQSGASIGATKTNNTVTVSGAISVSSGRNGTSNNPNLETFMAQNGQNGADWTSRPASAMIARSFGQNTSVNADYRMFSWLQHHITLGRSETEFQVVPEYPRFSQAWDTLYRYRGMDGARLTGNYNANLTPRQGIWFSHTISLGVNGSAERSVQTRGCGPTSSSETLISCERGAASTDISDISIGQRDNARGGGFGQWRIGFLERLFITLGVRAERSARSYGEEHRIDWTPTHGVALTHEWNDLTIKLLGSYGRATREPTASMRDAIVNNVPSARPSHYTYRFANPYLTPEYSRGPQGGVEVYLGNLMSVSVNHYQQRVTDLIQQIRVGMDTLTSLVDGSEVVLSQWQYINSSTVKQYGWEATGSVNLRGFSFKGTYSWNESRVEKYHSPNIIGASFRGIPTHTANMTIGYAAGGTRVLITANVIGATVSSARDWTYYESLYYRERSYRSRAATGMPMWSWVRPSYMMSDLSMSHRLTRAVTFTANVTNLGNSYVTDREIYIATPGRQTFLGLSLRSPL